MRQPEMLSTAVQLSNPKTVEYQVVRTSLVPGLLKTVQSNAKAALPMKIFEVADVAFKDTVMPNGVPARNQRRLAAVYCSTTSGFEIIHGLVNRVMEVLGIPFTQGSKMGYSLSQSKGIANVIHTLYNQLSVQHRSS